MPKKLGKLKVAKTGAKLDMLKIEGDWQAVVKKSFQKKKPALGWPN